VEGAGGCERIFGILPVCHIARQMSGRGLLRRPPNQVGGGGVELACSRWLSPRCFAPPPPSLVRKPTQRLPTGPQVGDVVDRRRMAFLSPPVPMNLRANLFIPFAAPLLGCFATLSKAA
jgi:hypothetical protein